jgi:hypothetical protein
VGGWFVVGEHVTVKSVNGEGNPWQHGITYWPVTFDRNGQDFECTWGKKGDPPAIGETVEGDFRQQNGEWKFSKASKPQGGGSADYGGGGASKPGGREWKPESELDPEKVARITRAHSQNLAVELLNRVPSFAEAPKENKQRAITAWADFFDADVQNAAVVASAKAGLNATETPAIRPAAADGEIVDGDGIPF